MTMRTTFSEIILQAQKGLAGLAKEDIARADNAFQELETLVLWGRRLTDDHYAQLARDYRVYPSCTCERVECDCPCISGGLTKDGDVTNNVCFSDTCVPHGKRCMVRGNL